MKKSTLYFILSASFLAAFALFTVLVKTVSVLAVGPNGSPVGFGEFNKAVSDGVGVNFTLYNITDWGGILPIILGGVFAVVGLVQLIKRKSLKKVDKNVLALGILYAATFLVYAFFELVVINRRPVLIEGVLEASYPSSTTVLSLVFLISAVGQIQKYVKNSTLSVILQIACVAYSLFLVIGRIFAGVHWITDIFAGILISSALLFLYFGLENLFSALKTKKE